VKSPRTFSFAQVDAFTDRVLAGNPCAIVSEADALTDAEMLAIAKETNQSETAFLMRSSSADLKARYFTPECEIPLAGHPTIASIHFALETGLIRNTETHFSISLELRDGPVRVEVERRENQLPLIRMFQRKPIFGLIHNPEEVLPLFHLSSEDLHPSCPIQTVSTGTPQLMVALRSQETLKKLSMNAAPYKEYRKRTDFFSPHFFCLEGITAEASTFARHLGVPPDTAEDAFTGSATGGMAAFLWRYGLLKSPHWIAEQGHWMSRPGRAWVSVIGSPSDIQSVSVAGTAVSAIRGTLQL
jgi:trans-2,3-dihydro-3-hydroxyanthranilate isomerase